MLAAQLVVAVPVVWSQTSSDPNVIGPVTTRSAAAAQARLADADTLLSLSAEGAELYAKEDIKLDGYQYCSQAVALAEAGEFRSSIRAASKALHIAQATANDDLSAKAFRDLSIAYSYAGQLDKAEQQAREALKHPSKEPLIVEGPVWKVIGDVQARRGQYDEALKSYDTAAARSSERFKPLVIASMVNALIDAGQLDKARTQLATLPPPSNAQLAAQLKRTEARLLLAENKPAEALKVYQQIADGSGGSDSDYYRVWAYDGIARAKVALGDNAGAAVALQSAIDGFDRVRAQFRSEEVKMGLFSDVQDVFARAIDLNASLGQSEQAFDISERSRARALVDAVRDRRKTGALSADAATMGSIQAQLAPDERIVEFHSLKDRLLVWVVDSKSQRMTILPIAHDALAQDVDSLRDALVSGKASVATGAASLGAQLIDPLKLETGTRLIIVPHGPLHYLPFQALRSNGHWLIEDHPVAVEPSATIATQLASTGNARTRPSLVAFGNPEISSEFALPGAEAEVRTVAALFDSPTVFLEANATKTNFRASSGTARIVHVAAHAEADLVDPLHSRILLANEHGQRNYLEASEVLDLNLDRVSLVTLSACESGLGRVADGDEVLGFTRSFLTAGASSLIASLWPVSDDATDLLMSTLYARLRAGDDVQQAMQAAQLAVLKQRRFSHPYFWAPFNVIGNWRLALDRS
jgi:CHAT domain-containing protein/predicted negative regulator of RcsB-dependent stress response